MNRGWALVSVFALFLSGVSIGALGMHLLRERSGGEYHRHSFGFPPHAAGRYFADRLQLTPEQRDKIAAIRRDSWKESESLRRELRPRIEKEMAATKEKVLAILTPEQREKLEELLREEPHFFHGFLFGEGERHPPAPPVPLKEGEPPPGPGSD
jgi:Spy/CpxP family protein refolding chaperone